MSAPAPMPRDPQLEFKAMLAKARAAIVEVAPKGFDVDRLTKVVLSATAREPSLLTCSLASILRAVMQAAELGLEIGGLRGEAYLVPFNRSYQDERGQWRKVRECQCIPGYKGLAALALRSGKVRAIRARVVHQRDTFEWDEGLTPNLLHKPFTGEGDAGPVTHAYVVIEPTDGGRPDFEVMSATQINAIRDRNKRGKSAEKDRRETPWDTDYEEMCKKTVVRRKAKLLDLSPEFAKATELEDEVDAAERVALTAEAAPAIPASSDTKALRTQALANKIAAKLARPADPIADAIQVDDYNQTEPESPEAALVREQRTA